MTEREGIVGNGDIGRLLKEEVKVMPDLVFFVSGVSNSQEVRESEYQREKDLLLQQDRDKRLVYVSSLSIFYGDTRYTRHKREMEELIKEEFSRYTIFRLGNITWGDNPHTIINNLKSRVDNQEPIEIYDTHRYVVEPNEFLHWISLIPDFNCEINVPGERMKVRELVKRYVL